MTDRTDNRIRYEHGVGPQPRSYVGRDYGVQVAVLWSCLNGCYADLDEDENGMRCPSCGTHFTWDELGREDE